MATTYAIHPAIGVARVGNSPDMFIGPERVGVWPEPAGGFKDDACRVKRQAARFRIFATHDNGTVEEITAADAEITWTVHLTNSKAAYTGRGNSEDPSVLIINPGTRTLNAPNSHATFDNGAIRFNRSAAVTVPLGEMRLDDEGRLLVLGGQGHSASPPGNGISYFWGTPGWFDDTSDGPITATVQPHGDGTAHEAAGAWVIVAPPKFAPHQDSVTTLYDRLTQRMIETGLLAAPATTSYTHDIYPILRRAQDMAWVEGLFHPHQWTHPITDPATITAIVNRVLDPAQPQQDMPALAGSDSNVTATQYQHLQRWKNGQAANDWAGQPYEQQDITPAGLDQAALDACVGGAFFPGIEAGGRFPGERPILEKPYVAAYRLDHTGSSAGDITASMALPWQADFYMCKDNWWPVPRPNDVRAAPGAQAIRWDRHVGSMDEMVTKWSTLGFIVKQAGEHLETQECGTRSVTLTTPHLNFKDVAQGPLNGVREVPLAITFEVQSPAAATTLRYTPGAAPNHPQLVAVTNSVTVPATAGSSISAARLWIVFRTDSAGSAIPTQLVTVEDATTGQRWQITIDGNTIPRTTTAVALALDRSGSMSEDRGDGQTKHASLQQAANLFVDLMLPGDGIGIARFDQDAQPLQPVLQLGDGQLTDLNRAATHDTINGNGLDPAGATAIGDGIFEARSLLGAAAGYGQQALVVLTDGIENQPRYIADVAAQIDATTYAVGLGKPENISVSALETISGNNGGYLLVTGPITQDNRFRLQKHFLQILSGVNRSEVVLDPDGELLPGRLVRIPFRISDADSGVEVVLLTPLAKLIDFRLLTPSGQLIEPWLAQNDPAMTFAFSDGAAFYRLALPAQLQPNRFDQDGTWHALLTIGEPRTSDRYREPDRDLLIYGPAVAGRDGVTATTSELQRRFELGRNERDNDTGPRRTLPYSLSVHTYSTVSFRADIHQSSHTPGAAVNVRATLTQSGLDIDDADITIHITGPVGAQQQLTLQRQTGEWAGTFNTSRPGVYHLRARAHGRTRNAIPFTREQQLTATAWLGADSPQDPAGSGRPPANAADSALCQLLTCLTRADGPITDRLRRQLIEEGFDIDLLARCIETSCGNT